MCSDFTWLHDQLSELHPGSIIPALPDKQALGRFEPEFIESRRRAMEKFLNRVTKHPDLINSKVLVPFLSADDATLTHAKEERKSEKSKSTKSVTSWFESKVNSLTVTTTQVLNYLLFYLFFFF